MAETQSSLIIDGKKYFKKGDYQKAKDLFEDARKFGEKHYLYSDIGDCLSKLNKEKEAIIYYKKAINIIDTIDKKSILAKYYKKLADIYLKEKLYEDIIKTVNEAEEYAKLEDPELYQHLITAYKAEKKKIKNSKSDKELINDKINSINKAIDKANYKKENLKMLISDGLRQYDLTDLQEETINLADIENEIEFENDKINSYTIEATLFSALSFGSFVEIFVSNDMQECVNSLLMKESLLCTAAFVCVITTRLKFSNILKRIRGYLKKANELKEIEKGQHNAKEESHLGPIKNFNEKVVIERVALRNVNCFMAFFRYLGITAFMAMITTGIYGISNQMYIAVITLVVMIIILIFPLGFLLRKVRNS